MRKSLGFPKRGDGDAFQENYFFLGKLAARSGKRVVNGLPDFIKLLTKALA